MLYNCTIKKINGNMYRLRYFIHMRGTTIKTAIHVLDSFLYSDMYTQTNRDQLTMSNDSVVELFHSYEEYNNEAGDSSLGFVSVKTNRDQWVSGITTLSLGVTSATPPDLHFCFFLQIGLFHLIVPLDRCLGGNLFCRLCLFSVWSLSSFS